MDVLAGGAGAEALDKVADAAKNSGLVNKFNNLDVDNTGTVNRLHKSVEAARHKAYIF
jgi:hypothetical protein